MGWGLPKGRAICSGWQEGRIMGGMPGFQDSAFLVLLALLLFGPKKLPVLARQLGKLMGDFRRASNEFRAQMEDELRLSEQADRQKEIAKLEAAAPKPALTAPIETSTEERHALNSEFEPNVETHEAAVDQPVPAPMPIATSGELKIMPPATGLPVANTSLAPFLDSIPAVADSNGASHNGASHNGIAHEPAELSSHGAEQETEARPWMI
jgi:sec-independent protein translocase protein TatB